VALLEESNENDEKRQKAICAELQVHRVYDILESLPTRNITKLADLVKEMSVMDKASFSQAQWAKICHVFCMEALMCIHEAARDVVARILRQIDEQMSYFQDRLCRPLFDTLCNVTTYCEEASLGPLDAGVMPWISSVMYARRVKLRRYLRKLSYIRRRLRKDEAFLRSRLKDMEQYDHFESNPLKLWPFADALHRQLEGADPTYSRDQPFPALQHLIKESLSEFESRVADFMDLWDLHKPSHLARLWPAYLTGALAALVVSHSPGTLAVVKTTGQLGDWVIWEWIVPRVVRLLRNRDNPLQVDMLALE